MQVAPDAAPLLLAEADKSATGGAKLAGEHDRVDGRGDLGRQVGDEPLVALSQAVSPARREQKLADRGIVVDERDSGHLPAGSAVGGGHLGTRPSFTAIAT